jgi:hypothetical protein
VVERNGGFAPRSTQELGDTTEELGDTTKELGDRTEELGDTTHPLHGGARRYHTPTPIPAIRATQHLAPSKLTIVACAQRRITNIEYGRL